MEKIIKRRKGYVWIAIIVFAFIVLFMAGDFLMFIFEKNVNNQINSLDDSFRAIETIYKVAGHNPVYPVTAAGRGLALVVLFASIILLIMFAAQVWSILNTFNLKKVSKKIEKEIDKDQDEILDEIEESQNMEKNILQKQQQIIEHEQDIMKKLDELRQESKDKD